jgi:hypothetical protein
VDLYIHSPIHLHGVVLNHLSVGTILLYDSLINAAGVPGMRRIIFGRRLVRISPAAPAMMSEIFVEFLSTSGKMPG